MKTTYKVKIYQKENGERPYDDWIDSLSPKEGARITSRINRIELGNLGKFKPVGEGVYELKIDFGPGYRVYFGKEGNIIILLLNGGTKRHQQRDIDQAKKYWKKYKDRGKKDGTKR